MGGIANVLDYLTIKKFCAESGYTEDACYSKMSSGVWLEGEVWIKAPDGRIHIRLKGYYAWLEQQSPVSVLPQKPRRLRERADAAPKTSTRGRDS
jgi:hypothetical protein